jgi:hypothetical protein
VCVCVYVRVCVCVCVCVYVCVRENFVCAHIHTCGAFIHLLCSLSSKLVKGLQEASQGASRTEESILEYPEASLDRVCLGSTNC